MEKDLRKDVTLGSMVLLNVVNLGLTGFWAFDGAVMPLFLTSKFELSNTAISLILGIGKFMIVLSLFFGIFSDYTQTGWGKRKPLILIGGLISAPLIAMIPHMPAVWALVVLLTVIYFNIQFAAVPYFSLVPEVVPNEKLGTANAFFSIFGGLGTVLAYAVILTVVYKANKSLAFYVIALIHLIGTLTTVIATKEHPQPLPRNVSKLKVMIGSISEIIGDAPKYPSLFWFLTMNLFFWLGLGAFIVFFTKAMEYYVNIPGEKAGYVLGTVVFVSIALAVPVGLLGDKKDRKKLNMIGLVVILAGLLAGYLTVGPTSSVSGLDLANSAAVEKIAVNYGLDVSGADLSAFENKFFSPSRDVNQDEMQDKKSDVMRWCLNGALQGDSCASAAGMVLGADNPALAPTVALFETMSQNIQKETTKVLIIAFMVIAFAAIGLTVCFVIMATILPTLMPDGKLGLYMGFYSTVTGIGQLLSLFIAGLVIDATLNNPALGYRWIFIQGTFFMLVAIFFLSKVPHIPSASEPTVADLEKQASREKR